ncbi:MAG TPA: transglutaminase domain-containing protein, partial [Byssovorax sp.]
VEARALRATARSSLGVPGAERVAATELSRLVDELGARAPRSMLEDLALAAHGVDPEAEIRARAAMNRLSPGYEAPALVHAWANRGGAAASGAAFAELYAVDDIHDVEAIVDAVARTGRPLELAEIARRAIELDPNVSALHRHRAEALFAIAAGRADLRAAGVAELTRAGAMNSARSANEEIGLREGRPAAVVRDERYLAEPSTFLARARATPAIPGQVEARILHYERIVTLHPERRVTELVHYAREIVAPPTGDADLVEQVQLWGRTYDIVRARVHRRDGGVASAEEERADAKGVRIKWPDLKPGDVVEVAVRAHRPQQGGRGDAPLYVVVPLVSHSTRPLLHGEVVVESPLASPLAIEVLNGAPDETKRTSDAKHVTVRYVWNAPPTFDDEPLAPGPSEIFPTVVASRQATWREFRAWYESATQGFSEPDAQIRELADKLTKGKATRDERIRALFDFVSDDIRYVNYQSAEAWLPNRPQQLLARRQGDCDDKATLLITLLKAIGVDATLALVQTRLHPAPSLLTAKGAVAPLFDHGIAYVPARGGAPAMWLDATSPESRVGPLPAMDLRASAFFVSEGEPVVTRAPAGSPSDHGFDYRWTIELATDGSAKVDAENLARGGSAYQVRSALRENTNRASWVEEHIAGQQLPQVAVEPKVEVDAEQPNGAARVKFRARSAAFARREHGDLVVRLGDHATLASQIASAPTRTLPLVLPFFVAPHEDVETLRVVAPEGMAPGVLPAHGVEDGGDFGRAAFDARLDPKDPRVVVVTIALALDLDVIPAARYAAYRAWLARVDALLRKEIRFTPRRR